jgi:hypothetical protein
MKNLLSAFIMLLICGLVIAPGVYAAGVDYGTTITNTASVDGANFSIQTANSYTNVQAIVGADWAGSGDTAGATSGAWVTNLSTINNYGNGNITYQIAVTNFATNSTGGSFGAWNWEILTNSGNYAAYASGNGDSAWGGNIVLSEGDAIDVLFRVQVDLSAVSATQSFMLNARATTPHKNTGRYQGEDSIWYGGGATIGWGEDITDRVVISGVLGIDAGNLYTITTASSPLITISKTITSITTLSGLNGVVVPGARITYQIRVTNEIGAGDATGVVVTDDVTSGFVSLDAGSMGFDGGASENSWNMGENGNVMTWTNAGLFENGNVARLSFTVVVN